MLAISTAATIVSAVWVGVLTLVLVAQAVRSWWAWHYVARAARQAARLARAMERASETGGRLPARVVELRPSPPTSTSLPGSPDPGRAVGD